MRLPAIAGRSFERPSIARLAPLLPWLLATWFVTISAMRLAVIAPFGIGFDARIYRAATAEWLAGGNPWLVSQGGVYFGAPPPSLLPMVPFALVPEAVAVGALVALGVASNAWAIRRLGLPIWWLAFPPLVDALWNGNPHVLVMPLIVASVAPLAVVTKAYAAAVPLIRRDWRSLAIGVLLVVVTAPLLPWATFIAEAGMVGEQFRLTSGGGLSVWSLGWPWLAVGLGVSVAALAILLAADRERAAWLAVPAFWPYTQWYYSSIAIPGVAGRGAAMLAAAVLAAPVVGGPVLALVVLAVARLAGRPAPPLPGR